MNFRFWLSFFIFSLAFLLTGYFAGSLLAKLDFVVLERSLLKESIKLESLLHLEQLNKKLDFLIKEGESVQNEGKILPDSPFFAFVVLNPSQTEEVYISDDSFPLSVISQKQSESSNKEQTEAKPEKERPGPGLEEEDLFEEQIKQEKRNILIELSEKAALQTALGDFEFKSLKAPGRRQSIIVFVRSFGEEGHGIAFLKKDRKFFKLQTDFLKEKEVKSKEIFVVNAKGQLFFHTDDSKAFKVFGKKSPVRKFLKKLSQEQILKSSYFSSKPQKKSGYENLYHFHKWNKGDLFLVSKTNFPVRFFNGKTYPLTLSLWLLILYFIFIFFCLRVSRFVSAYNFLKQAILSFSKSDLFPVVDIPKNPLLFFYKNRILFLNQKGKKDQDKTEPLVSVNFQDLIRQELEKLKSRFPRIVVKEDFNSDIKLFGFERFMRAIVHELLLNALEAMGGAKELKLDISLKEEGDQLIFSVRDYGTGLDDKDYEKCFRMYYSTKSQTGVGLNLVQSIVQSNEGEIRFSSPEGGGLELCVLLPLKCFLKNHFEKQELSEK